MRIFFIFLGERAIFGLIYATLFLKKDSKNGKSLPNCLIGLWHEMINLFLHDQIFLLF